MFPNQRIILNFVMWFVQVARNPGIVVAIDLTILICHLKVADDACAYRIRRANARPTVDEASCLVVVDGIPNVRRNYRIVVTWFANAVQLNREGHWDAQPAQVTGQGDYLRSAPTVAIDNDGCSLLFIRSE